MYLVRNGPDEYKFCRVPKTMRVSSHSYPWDYSDSVTKRRDNPIEENIVDKMGTFLLWYHSQTYCLDTGCIQELYMFPISRR